MPERPDLPKNSSRLLRLLCALPEETQSALLALLRWQLDTQEQDLNRLRSPQDQRQKDQNQISDDSQVQPLTHPLRTMQLPDVKDYLKLRKRVRHLETTLNHLQALITREEWLPRQQFLERYPSISEGRLKHLLLERERNGLMESGALRQSGPRCPIFICPARFWKWFEER